MEKLFGFTQMQTPETPFFRSLFSLWVLVCARHKNAQA